MVTHNPELKLIGLSQLLVSMVIDKQIGLLSLEIFIHIELMS